MKWKMAEITFKHFIGTRFNLMTIDWKRTKSGNEVLTEEWLSDRFEIFEKFCLPSVMQQSELNFHWCIFFDENTPKRYFDRINAIKEKFPNISPILIGEMSELVHAFRNFILSKMDGHSHIITTRLDNDDLIHVDFVSSIQSLFRPRDLCVIDLRRGYQVSIDVEPSEVRNYSHPYNSFLSVIEPVNDFSTIYSRQHYHWKNEETIIFDNKPLWIELSHDQNYVNHRQTKLKRAFSFEHKAFALAEPFHITIFNTLIENLIIDVSKLKIFIVEVWKNIMKIPFRVKRWLFKNISQRIKKRIKIFLYTYKIIRPPGPWPFISNRLKAYFIKKVKYHNSLETLSVIRRTIESKNRGAYMRFGDGDIHLMVGLDDILNKCSKDLKTEMNEAVSIKGKNIHKTLPISSILFGYESGMKNGVHLVRDIDALRYLSVSLGKIDLNNIFSTTALHYIAEHDPVYCIEFLTFLKKTQPIFVGNEKIKRSVVRRLFDSIHITTPSNNAYQEIDRIENELIFQLNKHDNKFKVVVVAMGCSGRVLQKRILNKGFNVYLFDFGSLLDALNGDQTRAWVRLTGGVNQYQKILEQIDK